MAVEVMIKLRIENCPYCDAVAVETSRTELGNQILITLKCGHMYFRDKVICDSRPIIVKSLESMALTLTEAQAEVKRIKSAIA